jgi:hypothetical protein
MSDRHECIADLLMGAAYADKQLDGCELAKVKKLLGELMGKAALPAELDARLTNFEPSKLDVTGTVAALGLSTDDEKQKLVELVSAVHDADDVWDFDEDLYLRGVAAALGLSEEAYTHLTVGDIEMDVIGAALLPPPLPKKPSAPPPIPGKR